MTLSGYVIFNHVIIDAFRAAGFLLVMIGIFQVLSGKTTQKNKQTTERTPA
jgi:small neutral amino acid transporter SnatA (MarC family)